MIEDLNKGIDLITYNHLNLPTHIYFANNGTAGRRIGYVYTADGIKLRKYTHLNTNAEGPVTDYVGAFVYENNELQFIQTSEGRLVPDGGGGYNYEYALKDHLGNTRVMFSQTGEVLQDQSYYPFGMSMGEALTFDMPSSLPDNKYLYNGKELQDDFDLGWYDYGARFYDPAIGRFLTVDPHAENYLSWTPYNYVGNNPIRRIDPDGKDWDDVLDVVQTGLDVAGMVPAVGNIADLVNAGVSAARGDYVGAGLSLAAAVPVVGIAAGAAKTAKGVVKIADKANDAAKVSKAVSKAPTGRAGKTLAKKNGVTVKSYGTNDAHKPAHAHVKGGGEQVRVGANGKPLKGQPDLSTKQQKVVTEAKKEIRKEVNKLVKPTKP
jgi:RHS repeat-associated protein